MIDDGTIQSLLSREKRDLLFRIDTLIAERDAARADLADVRQMIGFAEESPDEHIVRVAGTVNQQYGWMESELNAVRADRDRLAACVERVRAVQQYRPIGYADCDVVGKYDMAEFSDRTVLVRYRDILAALEGK